jgi:hypothetical protein
MFSSLNRSAPSSGSRSAGAGSQPFQMSSLSVWLSLRNVVVFRLCAAVCGVASSSGVDVIAVSSGGQWILIRCGAVPIQGLTFSNELISRD